MATRLKPATVPLSRQIGRLRSISPNRARDEDLNIFLWLSERSLRTTARELEQLIRPV
jgi:hypothetical protein